MSTVPNAKRKVTESQKKRIATRQQFVCANSVSSVITDYSCPFQGKVFDESGYEIDHINELCTSDDNSLDNLQALCINCHRVKTIRFNSTREKKETKPRKKKTEETTQTTLVSDSTLPLQPTPPPIWNRFVVMKKIKYGLDHFPVSDHMSWRILENWALDKINKSSNNVTTPLSPQIIEMLHSFQDVRFRIDPEKPYKSAWSIIGNQIRSATHLAEMNPELHPLFNELIRILVNEDVSTLITIPTTGWNRYVVEKQIKDKLDCFPADHANWMILQDWATDKINKSNTLLPPLSCEMLNMLHSFSWAFTNCRPQPSKGTFETKLWDEIGHLIGNALNRTENNYNQEILFYEFIALLSH